MGNVIIVKQNGEARAQEELAALAADIYPGFLIDINSDEKVIPHGTAGGNVAPVKIALLDSLQGNDKDDVYAASAPVQVWTPQRGDWGFCFLLDGETVVIGDELESDGAGHLRKYTPDFDSGGGEIYQNSIVAIAREAKDLSDSSGGESSGALGYNKRIYVEFV